MCVVGAVSVCPFRPANPLVIPHEPTRRETWACRISRDKHTNRQHKRVGRPSGHGRGIFFLMCSAAGEASREAMATNRPLWFVLRLADCEGRPQRRSQPVASGCAASQRHPGVPSGPAFLCGLLNAHRGLHCPAMRRIAPETTRHDKDNGGEEFGAAPVVRKALPGAVTGRPPTSSANGLTRNNWRRGRGHMPL